MGFFENFPKGGIFEKFPKGVIFEKFSKEIFEKIVCNKEIF